MKIILFTILVLFSGISSSAIFQVNLTAQDQVDSDPGDGVCDIPTGGFCTLRAAVMEANALPGLDIITLPGNSTIRLAIPENGDGAASGDLDITETVSIGAFNQSAENFPTIDANGLNDRVFQVVSSSGTVSFVNFRVINGSADSGFGNGGAINISNDNLVNITRVWFEDNTADSGGAIFMNVQSELDIVDSVFRGNLAISQGGALSVFGQTHIDKSTVFENLNLNGDFREAIFVGRNQFGEDGLRLNNSTVFDNEDTGIYAVGADVRVQNSTIANHTIGVAIDPADNITPDLRFSNSIFDQNMSHCSTGIGVNKVTDNWNISSDNAFCAPSNPPIGTPTNLIEDPKLTSIKVDAENWHRYYRPGFFSPVVDSAHLAAPGPGLGCDLEDQRGVVRPQDAGSDGNDRCDRGAIELLEDVIFYDDLDISY